ncbi:hypothetical protein V500_04985, partial [Pseudogymnoascus sp. VKM F-4518 (FW-2643)]
MIGTSTAEYIFIRSCTLFLHNIAPVSLLYCVLLLHSLPTAFYINRLPLPIETWLVAEAAFFTVFFLPYRWYLQRSAIHPKLLRQEERAKLFERCNATVKDPEKYLSKWFLGAKVEHIKRENVKEFFRWAFLNTGQTNNEDKEEIEGYVKTMEKLLGRNIPLGKGSARSIRLTLDKVDCLHRSLLWYLCVCVVDTITYCTMLHNGFYFHHTSIRRFFTLFPLRPLMLLSTYRSPAKHLTYWYRPHSSKTRLPVLFIHGIGIGLYPYTNFLRDLNNTRESSGDDAGVGLIALEIMPISSRITHPALKEDVMVHEIQAIVKHHARGFFWSQNIVWKEDLGLEGENEEEGRDVTVVLSGRDLIVDTEAVRRYLTASVPEGGITDGNAIRMMNRNGKARVTEIHNKGTGAWTGGRWTGSGLELLWFEYLDHGQRGSVYAAMSRGKTGGAPELPFENARERDLYQYYQPSSSPGFEPDHIPKSSYDTTLSAFAQLATLRLNTRRALISLIDRTNQYILAEATQTLSLQSDSVHNDQDELWFGCTTLTRSQGLCEEALGVVPSPGPRRLLPLIINDLTQDARLKDRPFVTSRPSLRFYAAMPITTKAGFKIGCLCVMDDKPRDGLSNVEIGFLGDMVVTIMAHLEMGRVKEEHRRSEKMVKGLGRFVEGGSTLREWWLEVRNDKAWRQQRSKGRAKNNRPQPDLDLKSTSKEHISATKAATPEVAERFEPLVNPLAPPRPKAAEGTRAKVLAEPAVELQPVIVTQRGCDGISAALGDQRTLSLPTPLSSAAPFLERDVSPISSTRDDKRSANPNQNLRTSTVDLQETMLSESENLKDMFSRASNIIRECIEVDGTIFLDASIGTFGGDTGESRTQFSQSVTGRISQESVISISEEEHREARASDTKTSRVSSAGSYASQLPRKPLTDRAEEMVKMCGILGFSTAEKCSLEGDEASENYVPVEEAFLRRLLHRYPRGQIFSLGEASPVISSKSDTGQTVGGVAEATHKYSKKTLRRKRRASAKQTEANALRQMLPGARSVVLFPLWDSHRERWFAGSFAWTTQSTRVLTRAEDLSYLAAFGNSIMAEVARLDTIAADRA